MAKRAVVVVVTARANHSRVRAMVRWVRTLVPAAVLVVAPVGESRSEPCEDAIVVNADEIRSGPLSLADALVRAATAHWRAREAD